MSSFVLDNSPILRLHLSFSQLVFTWWWWWGWWGLCGFFSIHLSILLSAHLFNSVYLHYPLLDANHSASLRFLGFIQSYLNISEAFASEVLNFKWLLHRKLNYVKTYCMVKYRLEKVRPLRTAFEKNLVTISGDVAKKKKKKSKSDILCLER